MTGFGEWGLGLLINQALDELIQFSDRLLFTREPIERDQMVDNKFWSKFSRELLL
ncbi:hypothetical protein IQ264_28565 [Phormidium sp. LEGE 05292]|uniref:hypothetical protein n=1 Tax=[Phormidium] sp. LEGE 05292 TaxID=767427 RepID=UPI00187F1133|nr:hypothetical protein [Phormidium sp. LEGE 05292]MBE9229362.1 hypothetical protein [Phormidium sp. LEGE 05292]